MNQFDESWLRAYQAKRQVAVDLPDVISFTLYKPYKLLNVLLHMHWADRRDYAAEMADEIALETNHLPVAALPMKRARVTITRFSVKLPDVDGLTGGAKPVIDALLVRSDVHPKGLGFLVDDSPAHMDLVVSAELVGKRSSQRTTVLIERLPTIEETVSA